MQGRIKLHRQIQERPDWGSEPFTRGQARVDLVLLANHSEGSFYIRGNKITVKRGQVGRSETKLSEKRHWSRNKLRRWLKELETIQQIEQQKSPILSLITILNYEKYQGNDTTDDTTERQQTIQQKDTNKNDKKKKEGKEYIVSEKDLREWIDNEAKERFNSDTRINPSILRSIILMIDIGFELEKTEKRLNEVKQSLCDKIKLYFTSGDGSLQLIRFEDEVKKWKEHRRDNPPKKHLNSLGNRLIPYDIRNPKK